MEEIGVVDHRCATEHKVGIISYFRIGGFDIVTNRPRCLCFRVYVYYCIVEYFSRKSLPVFQIVEFAES
jgi:hypothetical protein